MINLTQITKVIKEQMQETKPVITITQCCKTKAKSGWSLEGMNGEELSMVAYDRIIQEHNQGKTILIEQTIIVSNCDDGKHVIDLNGKKHEIGNLNNNIN